MCWCDYCHNLTSLPLTLSPFIKYFKFILSSSIFISSFFRIGLTYVNTIYIIHAYTYMHTYLCNSVFNFCPTQWAISNWVHLHIPLVKIFTVSFVTLQSTQVPNLPFGGVFLGNWVVVCYLRTAASQNWICPNTPVLLMNMLTTWINPIY